MEIKIGDEVEVIENKVVKHLVGLCGKVFEIDDEFFGIEFYEMIDGGHDGYCGRKEGHCYFVFKKYCKKTNKFKIGDRVVVNGKRDGKNFENKIGTIIYLCSGGDIMVEFDDDIDGHGGYSVIGGNGATNHCWCVSEHMIEKYYPTATSAKIVIGYDSELGEKMGKFKEGDIVIVNGEWNGIGFVDDEGCVMYVKPGYLTVRFSDETWELPEVMCEKVDLNIQDSDNYRTLKDVLDDAYLQCSDGKGKERHANDNKYEDQVICVVQRLLKDHPFGGHAYQIIKKTIEAGRLYKIKGKEAAYQEILGAINYCAAMNILIKED